MILYGNKGKYVLNDTSLASGGEGAVFVLNSHPQYVAKIYHEKKLNDDPLLENKIDYMVSNPPVGIIGDDGSDPLIAWPMDILRDDRKKFRGFVMPKLEAGTELRKIYEYPPRPNNKITINHKIIIAANICTVLKAVHSADYVLGDFNPANIGVNLKTGHISFFDADSCHFADKNGGQYRCGVACAGYVAPELIKKCEGADYLSVPLPTFTKETDNFALAIHIFRLLMNGYTPFNGIKDIDTASTSSPGQGNAAIRQDNYCFKKGNKPQSVATPPLESLPPDIQTLFQKTFIAGKENPKNRVTAAEWNVALNNYLNQVKQCQTDVTHMYYNKLSSCPYCEADKRYKLSLVATSQSTPVISISNKSTASSQLTFSTPISMQKSSSNNRTSVNTNATLKNNSGTTTSRKKKKGCLVKLFQIILLCFVLSVLGQMIINILKEVAPDLPIFSKNENIITYTGEELENYLKNNYWNKVDDLLEQNKYGEALALLAEYDSRSNGYSKVVEKKDEIATTYISYTTKKAKEYIDKKKYEKAQMVLGGAISTIKANSSVDVSNLENLNKEVIKFIPVKFSQIEEYYSDCLGEYVIEDETIVDSYGNSYNGNNCYVLSANVYHGAYTIQKKVDGKYERLKYILAAVPNQSSTVRVQIIADTTIVYEGVVGNQTKPQELENDIRGAELLTINIYHESGADGFGQAYLIDPVLYLNQNEVEKTTENSYEVVKNVNFSDVITVDSNALQPDFQEVEHGTIIDAYNNVYIAGNSYYLKGNMYAGEEFVMKYLKNQYNRFQAVIAPIPEQNGVLYFSIQGDDRILYETSIESTTAPIELDIDVTGIDTMYIHWFSDKEPGGECYLINPCFINNL